MQNSRHVRWLQMAGLATAMATASPAAAAANLVRDGSFEDIYALREWDRNWTSPFVVEWSAPPFGGGPTDGVRHVRFTAFGIGSEISLFQTIATTPGTQYRLSFDAASGRGGGSLGKQYGVSWTPLGDPVQNFVIPRQTMLNNQYQTFTQLLVASSAQTVLRFSFWGEFDNGYLDNIILTEFTPGDTGGVPEPASWALLIAGFGLTGIAARRRRAHLFTSRVKETGNARSDGHIAHRSPQMR